MASSCNSTVVLKTPRCPVCFDIPTENIFQCKHGHIICSDCVKNLKSNRNCPQCRVPLGRAPIRNRALEALLDTGMFQCSNENCTKSLHRQELEKHRKVCQHRSVNVCPRLGFGDDDCVEMVTTGEELANHLKGVHHIKSMSENEVIWKNFFMKYGNPNRCKGSVRLFSFDGHRFLIKLIVSFHHGHSNGQLSFAISYLGDSPNNVNEYQSTLTIFTKFGDRPKNYVGSWTGLPIHFKAVENSYLPECVTVPMDYLKHVIKSQRDIDERADTDEEIDFDLIWEIRMSKSSPPTSGSSPPAKRFKPDLANESTNNSNSDSGDSDSTDDNSRSSTPTDSEINPCANNYN